MTTARQVDVTVNLLQGSTLSGSGGWPGFTKASPQAAHPTPVVSGFIPTAVKTPTITTPAPVATGIATAVIQAAASRPQPAGVGVAAASPAGPTTAQQGAIANLDRFAIRGLLLLQRIAENTAPGATGPGAPPLPPKTHASDFGRYAKQGFGGLMQMDAVPNGMAGAWTQLAAGTPAAATFAQSLRMLSLTVTQMLTPGLIQASGAVQGVARWIDHLDPATKSTIGNFAAWTGVAVGTGVALNTVGSAVRPLMGLVTGASNAITGFSGTLGMSRIAFLGWTGAAIAAVGTAAYLTNGFGLLNDSLERVSRNADEARQRIERLHGGGALTRQDYDTLPANVRRDIEGSPAGEARASVIRREIENATERRNRLMAADPSAMQARIEAALQPLESTGVAGDLAHIVQGGNTTMARFAAIREITGLNGADLGRRLHALGADDAFSSFQSPRIGAAGIRTIAQAASGGTEATTLESTLQSLRRVLENGVPGIFAGQANAARTGPRTPGGTRIMTAENLVPPQLYGGGQQLYEAMLTEALGKTEIEMENQRLLMQSVREQQRTNQLLETQQQNPLPVMPQRRGG